MRALRARLGLDSGHLSRLLRSLEAAGLITVAPGEHDRRVRVARAHRRRAWPSCAELDRRSDALAASLLEPLTARAARAARRRDARRRAAADAPRWSRSSPSTPSTPTRAAASRSYFAELERRSRRAVRPARRQHRRAGRAAPAQRASWSSPTCAAEPVGCGALKHTGAETTDIKRMWLRRVGARARARPPPAARARGAAPRAPARAPCGSRPATSLHEAIALYRSAGYEEVPAFNDEPFAHHWFAKELGAAPRARAAR